MRRARSGDVGSLTAHYRKKISHAKKELKMAQESLERLKGNA